MRICFRLAYLSGAGLEVLTWLADRSTLPPITISFHPRLGDGTQITLLRDVLDDLLFMIHNAMH